MKNLPRPGLIAFLILLWLTCAASAGAAPQVLFQVSTLQALMNGVYGGDCSFKELSSHGDFGLGTVEALDGEMVAVDGRFYQVKSDGAVYPISPSRKTPFAEVTFFKPGQTLSLREPLDLRGLETFLLAHLPSKNFPYAIKLTGKFAYVKTRSVPRQTQPYPPLTEVVKRQAVFELRDVEGVIVGFWHPQYLAGVNLSSCHFHFLTRNRQAGGHLLDCRLKEGRLELQGLDELRLRLPATPAFSRTGLGQDQKRAIDQAEK